MENKLIVNQIIPFSNVDGSGNRFAIFLQGCNVQCVYCHNPETIRPCNQCGDCLEVCQTGALTKVDGRILYHPNKCIGCNACIERCTFYSTPKAIAYDLEDLVEKIKSYQPFIRGITISGGEPTLQQGLLVDLFKKINQLNLTCFVDTNGYFDREEIKELIEVTDQFLFDVKTTGDSKKLCSVPSLSSIENLQYLLKVDKIEEVRTVLIHSYMDCKETVQAVSNILKHYPKVIYKLIKVHEIGLKETQKNFVHGSIPTNQEVLDLVQLAKENGLSKVSYVL